MKNQKSSFIYSRRVLALSLLIPFLSFTVSGYGASGNSSRAHGRGMSKGAQGAAKGGLGGAALGALIGAAAGNAGKGAAIGAASGLILGGAMGHARDVREREEVSHQARIAEERAYQREVIGIRQREALESRHRAENLAIQEGFSTTPAEVMEVRRRADEAERRLKELQAQVAEAMKRDKILDEAVAREKEAEKRIRELEAQLKALKKD